MRKKRERAYQCHIIRKVSCDTCLFTSDSEQIVAVDGSAFVVHFDKIAHPACKC